MKEPTIAVIILNWNGEKLLQEFLPAVIANTDPDMAKIIVADNGSNDNSVDLIQKDFPGIEVIVFDKNYGFAEGYNRAIELTKYQYTILLNSDVAPAKGWIAPLKEYMDKHKEAGACQPKLLSYKNPDRFEYAGACGGFLDKHGYPYCRGRIFDNCEVDLGQYDSVINVFWATGAALMVRTEAYIQAGGLDANFFAHMEEIDLCWRLQLLGYSVAVVPQSIVYHLGGGSLPASNPKKTYLNFRNNLLMMHKNLPDKTRTKKLFIRRLLDTVALMRFLVSGDLKNALSIWKAHCDFRKMRLNYCDHPSKDLLSNKTDILWSFFFKGKSIYSKL